MRMSPLRTMQAQRDAAPKPRDKEAVRAAIAQRERETAERQAALVADEVLLEVQRCALMPEGGWWRDNARKHGARVLRVDVVVDAFAVGCTKQQIAKASGASIVQIRERLEMARRNPNVESASLRNLQSRAKKLGRSA